MDMTDRSPRVLTVHGRPPPRRTSFRRGGERRAGILRSCRSRSSARPGSSSRPVASASCATPGSTRRSSARGIPFPANDGIDPERIGHPTFLYVSHLHHDHFDPRYLRDHVDKDATVLLPAYPIEDLQKELRALGFHRFIESVDLEPFEAGPLTLTIHALVAPTDGPIGDSALLDRRRRGPGPQHERLAAARARPAARGRPARCGVPPVLRGDLVPDGLRLPRQRPGGPRAQEAGGPARPCVPLHRGPRPGVRRALGRPAVLPRRRPLRATTTCTATSGTRSPTSRRSSSTSASTAATAAG